MRAAGWARPHPSPGGSRTVSGSPIRGHRLPGPHAGADRPLARVRQDGRVRRHDARREPYTGLPRSARCRHVHGRHQEARRSIRKLAAWRPHVACFGHGRPMTNNAAERSTTSPPGCRRSTRRPRTGDGRRETGDGRRETGRETGDGRRSPARRVALPRLQHDDLRGRLRLDVGLERLRVGLDRREGVVVARDHGPGADQVRRDDGVVAVHRVVAADRHQRDVDRGAVRDQPQVAEEQVSPRW